MPSLIRITQSFTCILKQAYPTIGSLYQEMDNRQETLFLPYVTVEEEKPVVEQYYVWKRGMPAGMVVGEAARLAFFTQNRMMEYALPLEEGMLLLSDSSNEIAFTEKDGVRKVVVTIHCSGSVQGTGGKENEGKLASGEKEIADNEQKLKDGEKEISENEQKLKDSRKDIKKAEKDLEEGKKEYEDGKRDAEKEIADGEKKIQDAQDEIDDISMPEWMVTDRNDLPEYSVFQNCKGHTLLPVLPLLHIPYRQRSALLLPVRSYSDDGVLRCSS